VECRLKFVPVDALPISRALVQLFCELTP
jgi:hypothetical protein